MNLNTYKWIIPGVKCWLDVSKNFPETCYAPVEILSYDSMKKALVKTIPEGKICEVENQFLLERNEDVIANGQGYEDLVQMAVLNEPEILNNLALRFRKDIIFTSIGPTLLILNPYKDIPGLFTEDTMRAFRKKSEKPHIFSLAYTAYSQLIENQKNQAIVISGESGAGKTETTKTLFDISINSRKNFNFLAKYAMRFLISSTPSNRSSAEETPVEEKILRCNPILEAFGNSKTVRNDNSSRFGKFVRLLINKTSKSITGATITSYLLEKSRLTAPSKGERNFHIFYHLLAGCEGKDLQAYGLLDPGTSLAFKAEYFEYLRKSQCFSVPKRNDKELFHEVMDSFHKTSFTSLEIKALFRLLGAILHMGNLEFDASKLTDTQPCLFKSGNISLISQLMQVNESALIKSLVFKTREIQGQTIESPHPLAECVSIRDSLSKFLYEKLFNWLVKRLNLVIFPPEEVSNLKKVRKSIISIRHSLKQADSLTSSIALLDIFGFENFENNSFEQLCINFTNERLQQLYVSYVFKAEERELTEQGLKGSIGELAFQDNQAIIDLLDKYPNGIYDLLDESSSLGAGTDELFLGKLAKTHGKHPNFLIPKNKMNCFVLVHTAKPVEYDICGFRAKNKDEISIGIQMMLEASKDELLGQMINFRPKETQEKKKLGSVGVSKTEKFLGAKFRSQMKELMIELFSCEVHFIRCIKPNEVKKEGLFLADFTLLQIRYLGLLDSIKIRKQGFPYRKDYEEFAKKYSQLIGFTKKNEGKENLREFFEKTPNFGKEIGKKILFGKTKVYMKQEIQDQLEDKMMAIWKSKLKVASRIHKQYKVFCFKKKVKIALKNLKTSILAVCRIQAILKAKVARARFLKKKLGAIKINKSVRILGMKLFFRSFSYKIRKILKNDCFLKGIKRLSSIKPPKSTLKKCFIAINSFPNNGSFDPLPSPPNIYENVMFSQPEPREKNENMVKSLRKNEKSPEKPEQKSIDSPIRTLLRTDNRKSPERNEKSVEKIEKPLSKTKPNNNSSKASLTPPENPILQGSCKEISLFPESSLPKPMVSPHLTKKSSFFKENEEKLAKDAEKTLHINLNDIFKSENEKTPPRIIDPCNFEGNFIDFAGNLISQETFSPLHHYTIYGSTEEPESISFSVIPVSNDCFDDLENLDQDFMKFLKVTDWRSGMTKLLSPKRFKKHSYNEIMSHRTKKLKSALQEMSSKLNEQAILIFKYILQYSFELKTKFPLTSQLKKLLKILLHYKDIAELTDEFYLQIAKQIINCPSINTLKRLLQLLGIVSSVIAVTPRMFMPFMAFLLEKIGSYSETQDQDFHHLARFAFRRVKGLFESGSRNAVPLDNELFLIENMKKILVTINFLLGNHIFIYVESYTTIKEAILIILKKLGLETKVQYFGLYQCIKTEAPVQYEEKFLEDSIKIMDVFTSWEYEAKPKRREMKLFIRQKLFYKFPSDDLDSFEMLYSHLVYEVLRGRLEFDESTALMLGAYSLAVDHGDFSKEKVRFLKINIERYIPEHLLPLNPPQVWIDRIVMNYLKIKNYDRTKAKLNYLDLLRSHPLFLAEQFQIEYTVANLNMKGNQIQKKEKHMLFTIKPSCIELYDLHGLKCVMKYRMKEIRSWGLYETTKLLIETMDETKHLVKSSRCQEIDFLIRNYIDFDNK